jgi:hypothetical protein
MNFEICMFVVVAQKEAASKRTRATSSERREKRVHNAGGMKSYNSLRLSYACCYWIEVEHQLHWSCAD